VPDVELVLVVAVVPAVPLVPVVGKEEGLLLITTFLINTLLISPPAISVAFDTPGIFPAFVTTSALVPVSGVCSTGSSIGA
jgi:hypothetical protein